MAKYVDPLKQLVALKQELFAERARLQARLDKLDQKLVAMGVSGDRFYSPRTPTGRYRNLKPLRDTVVDILREHPAGLTKEEVLHHVLQAGYSFSTNDPLNSLGVVLYGRDPKFKRTGQRFSL